MQFYVVGRYLTVCFHNPSSKSQFAQETNRSFKIKYVNIPGYLWRKQGMEYTVRGQLAGGQLAGGQLAGDISQCNFSVEQNNIILKFYLFFCEFLLV